VSTLHQGITNRQPCHNDTLTGFDGEHLVAARVAGLFGPLVRSGRPPGPPWLSVRIVVGPTEPVPSDATRTDGGAPSLTCTYLKAL
jgi:hypothetical protein